MRYLPLALVISRLCLGLLILAFAFFYPSRFAFAACLTGAFLSDYFDGVIARRYGVATINLRRLDSIADTVFYACALIAALGVAYELIRPYFPELGLLLLIELARYAYDIKKFGKESSYHMWSSKVWGVLLFVGLSSVLVFHSGGWAASLAIYWGIAADLEGLAISMTLRKWQIDVPTLWHARQFSKVDV